jgi:hypothetical protein
MKAVAVVGLKDIHSALALELEDLVHILPAHIGAWAQRTDCAERGRLEVWLMRGVVESRRRSRVLAQVVRTSLVGDEPVAVERAALVVKEQAV